MYIDTATMTGTPVMTRTEKLTRWAELIRKHPYPPTIFHRLEYLDHDGLRAPKFHSDDTTTVFGIATSDPKFQEAGLVPTDGINIRGTNSVKDIMDFFELTQAQLHEFSCDCGGPMHQETMARRVESLR